MNLVPNTDNKLQLQGSAEVAKGNFANITILNHNAANFLIDFAFLPPGSNKGIICSRIVMTPMDLKKFFLTLNDNITKYENKFGEIKLQDTTVVNNTQTSGKHSEG